MTTTTSSPVFSTRHRRLDVAVWANQGNQRTFYNTTLQRSYRQDEEWKHTSASFGRQDLLPAAQLLEWADATVLDSVEANSKADNESKPLASKRRGTLDVAVWQKTTEDGTQHRVSLKRSYKDGEEWKEVRVWLGADDCLSASRLLTRTFDAIDNLLSDNRSSSFVETARNEFGATVDESDDIPF